MNRHAQALAAKIENKKNEIRAFAEAGKAAEVKKAKKELDDLQAMFEAVKDLDDEGAAGAAAAAGAGTAQVVGEAKTTMKEKITAFVGIITAGIRKTQPKDEHVKVYNAMTEADPSTSTGYSDGGLTVPKDIRTQIEELRRTQDDLEKYVNVEPVTTLTGSRVIEVDADATPWDNVDEAAAFPEASTPQFKNVEYKVKKRGGVLKITEELLQDTAENIMGYLKKWIAKKSRATRNAFILKLIHDTVGVGSDGKLKPNATVKEIADIDGLKDVFNVDLDPAIVTSAKIFTNQSGFSYLDKLKDSDGNYILQPDPTQPTKKLLFGTYEVVKLLNKTLKTRNVYGSGSDANKVVGYAYPFICGDLKEAVTLFDRENMTIEISKEAGDLWGKDQTGIKVRDRFDVQLMDGKAFEYCEMIEALQG